LLTRLTGKSGAKYKESVIVPVIFHNRHFFLPRNTGHNALVLIGGTGQRDVLKLQNSEPLRLISVGLFV
jgi:hypothetical protein